MRGGKRGGANGVRIRLAPQKDWEVNEPAELAKVLQPLEQIQQYFNRSQSGGKKVPLAALIVVGGCVAIEQAPKNAGHDITVPFGRTDASEEQTAVESFTVLEPTADGFRNYLRAGEELSPENLLLDRGLCVDADRSPMTALIGGHARPERLLRSIQIRRLHRPTRNVDQRLLREPARHTHGVEGIRLG